MAHLKLLQHNAMQVQEGIGNSEVYVNTVFTSELNRKKCTNLIFRL